MTSLFALTACKDNITGPSTTDDTGDGPGESPNIVLGVTELDFGIADDVGVVLQQRFGIQNNGVGDLEITAFNISGPFQVPYSTLTIASQSSVQITVSYLPDAYSAFENSLVLVSNDPDEPEVSVALIGGVLVDRDGDGHDRPEAGGDDCDDEDSDVYPGAPEVWYNGSDENCDGLNDYDQDQDGYMTSVEEENPERGGGDCNDVNATIFPGAEDTWYDGVDRDCAGNDDFDQDEDGYASLAYGRGRDCDDFDDQVYPNATERLNGRLDDCYGEAADHDVLASAADYYYIGDAQQVRVGYSVAAGDIDQDGIDDVVFGVRNYNSGQGAVAMQLSSETWPASGSAYTDVTYSFAGSGTTDYLGSAVHVMDDFDGDGDADLVVGGYGTSSSYGAIYIISVGDAYPSGGINDAHTYVTGTSSHYYVGRSIASGDMDGDGLSDLVYNYSNSTNTNSGYNYIGILYGGSASGAVSGSSVTARFTTSNQEAAAYEALGNPEDINGDGYDDLVWSDQYADSNYTNDGATYILWGNATRWTNAQSALTSSAERVVTGNGQYDRCGEIASTIPDVNDDGFAEFVTWCLDDGTANVFYGDSSTRGGGARYAREADLVVDFGNSYSPSVFRGVGDWTGDGVPDWGLGIDGSGASTPGRLYILDGYQTGLIDPEDSNASIITSAEDNNVYFTHAVPSRPGDFDGNGLDDLLVGDPGYDADVNGDGSEDASAGSVWVFLQGS
ncbi:MAG: FG-GAP repeat protein [Alphaproteobacteria bacterium]|nr:FG-GAP repeat protein [Alphaproteobacteria bacterium]